MRFFLKYPKSILVLFIIATVTILYGTLYPAEKLASINILAYDKLAHFGAFAVWTFLFGLVKAVRSKNSPSLWMIFFLGLFYGLLVEILQLILPTNRSPELYDFIADALGSVAAVIALHFILKKKSS